ncbi:MAG: type I glyceraldehyde-3-phosphate dehydrogenase [Deltaproteobacteria bacterium]|nr:type I glyceraldehyde-3-phosphate dehydrogenase [Candidatus Zymogenaceae bacterium]
MMNVAINGLGRIGRLVLRHSMSRTGSSIPENPAGRVNVIAANDLTTTEELAYLTKYDSVHGRADFDVSYGDDYLQLNSKKIQKFSEQNPAALPWGEMGVDIVLECTGRFSDRNAAAAHLEAGAKKVIISAPSPNADLTVVMGVNEDEYDGGKHHVISNASCTTNSLAPPAKVLNDAFGIEYLFATTIHAYTTSQGILDIAKGPGKKRRGRAAALSLIPSTTGAAKATAKVLPELKGKMDAIAVRVPVPDGAITDVVAHLKKKVTVEEVNEAFKKASEGAMRGILAFTEDELVSADILSDPHSCTIDASSTMVLMDNVVKVLIWYDNEYGYAGRLLDLAGFITDR